MPVNCDNESLIVAMPVYDRVEPRAWGADMAVASHLGRLFDNDRLAFTFVDKLTYPHSFEKLCTKCLESLTREGRHFGWMLWVEHDQTPPANCYDLLRAHADAVERPIVHCLSFDRKPPYAPSIWRKVECQGRTGYQPIWDYEPDRLYRIAHSGTCCTLFHMSVWAKMERPWFADRPHEKGKGMHVGWSLSLRLEAEGIPIHAYTGCIVKHIGDAPEIGPLESARNRPEDIDSTTVWITKGGA